MEAGGTGTNGMVEVAGPPGATTTPQKRFLMDDPSVSAEIKRVTDTRKVYKLDEVTEVASPHPTPSH